MQRKSVNTLYSDKKSLSKNFGIGLSGGLLGLALLFVGGAYSGIIPNTQRGNNAADGRHPLITLSHIITNTMFLGDGHKSVQKSQNSVVSSSKLCKVLAQQSSGR